MNNVEFCLSVSVYLFDVAGSAVAVCSVTVMKPDMFQTRMLALLLLVAVVWCGAELPPPHRLAGHGVTARLEPVALRPALQSEPGLDMRDLLRGETQLPNTWHR